jgi:hypothetical protein
LTTRHATIIAAMLLAGPAMGQTWQATTGDSTALLYASAFAPGGTTSFDCTTPSPQGVPLIQTGDHETTRTDRPYDMMVRFNVDLIDPFVTPNQLQAVRIILDGVAYQLPMVEYQDFYGAWYTWLPMTDGLFLGLTLAREMVVDTGTGAAWSYPTDGLRDAFLTAASHCIRGWEQQGQQTPGALAFWRNGPSASAPATAPAPAPATGSGLVTGTPLVIGSDGLGPDGLPVVAFQPPMLDHRPGEAMGTRAIRAALAACGGPASFDDYALVEADFDGDGQHDILLTWNFVNCAPTGESFRPPAGICNADNQCLHSFFVSSGAAAGAPDWNVAAGVATYDIWTGPGQVGATFIGPVCERFGFDFVCAGRFGWAGTGFALLQMQQVPYETEGQYAIDGLVTSNIGYNAIRSTTLPPGYQLALLEVLPEPAPQVITDHLAAQCGGGYDVDIGHVQSADMDGDGVQDFVLNWAGMQCGAADFGATGCGAGNCLIDVFLSAQGYVPPEQLLGALADVVIDTQGRIGLLLSGTPFVCADGACDSPFYWNGVSLAQ